MIECARCHTSLPDTSRFCSSCGFDVTGGGQDAATSAQTENLMDRLQRLVAGKYEVRRALGKGGMGVVFLAQDLTLEREVAIKVLPPDISQDPQVIKRFQQEAKTAAKLDHPNIIPIYRVESEGGLNYFVMKYIAGTSLEDVLERRQPLAADYIQRVLWEAACALGHAHQRGVVHRDVKPANIMFDHDGRVMLTDFGISKALQAASGFTGTGMIIGTPHYMAPEQAKGAPVDGRADQYSLGVVAYRMVTGELPFTGDSVHTILYKHIFEDPPRAARTDVPEFVSAAIGRALSKDPDQRFPTMEEFATAVWPEQPVPAPGKGPGAARPRARVVAADVPTEVTTAPTTPLPAARPRPGRPPAARPGSRAGWIAGILLLAGGGAAGYLVLRPGGGKGGGPAPSPPGSAAPGVVQVAPSQVTLQPGERTGLTATVFDQDGRLMAGAPVRWTSSAEAVARVDGEGVVTALGPGTATIVAQAGERRAEAVVEVRAPAPATGGGRQEPRPQTGPPPVQQGFITVNSEPPSTVFIDGREVGQTPVVEFAVAPGTHTIRLERPGYRTVSERVQVAPGETVRRRWFLQEGSDR
ncbi:MAG TPA: protein kinase [Gemmatimonadales bacterium]|nr:protein kinase [Gemmatimonadales bacterium]